MRKLAIVLPLCLVLGSCGLTWAGQGQGLTDSQKEDGLRDVAALSSEVENESFYRDMRRRRDGLSNAFARDLDKIQGFFDRHFLNYSASDPYVNFPSDQTRLGHTFRFAGSTLVGSPLWIPVEETTHR